jgi:hypothetical protein
MIIGLIVDNPFVTVVTRSVMAMFCFYILGCSLSALGQKVIQENFENEFKNENQSDDSPDAEINNVSDNADLEKVNTPQPVSG